MFQPNHIKPCHPLTSSHGKKHLIIYIYIYIYNLYQYLFIMYIYIYIYVFSSHCPLYFSLHPLRLLDLPVAPRHSSRGPALHEFRGALRLLRHQAGPQLPTQLLTLLMGWRNGENVGDMNLTQASEIWGILYDRLRVLPGNLGKN